MAPSAPSQTIFDADRMLTRGSDHVETFQNGQTLAMSLQHGKYFALRGTAQRIWELLETPQSSADLAETLSAEYDVTPDQCLSDLVPFIEQLEAFGLIAESPG